MNEGRKQIQYDVNGRLAGFTQLLLVQIRCRAAANKTSHYFQINVALSTNVCYSQPFGEGRATWFVLNITVYRSEQTNLNKQL